MTTKNSPLAALQAQADKIAATIKAAERGEPVDVRFGAKIADARNRPSFKVGIVMDDKVITLEMSWETIRGSDEAGLAAFIVREMQEKRDAPH